MWSIRRFKRDIERNLRVTRVKFNNWRVWGLNYKFRNLHQISYKWFWDVESVSLRFKDEGSKMQIDKDQAGQKRKFKDQIVHGKEGQPISLAIARCKEISTESQNFSLCNGTGECGRVPCSNHLLFWKQLMHDF